LGDFRVVYSAFVKVADLESICRSLRSVVDLEKIVRIFSFFIGDV